MRRGNVFLNSIAACGLALASPAALADHIPGHDDCDPVFPIPLPGEEFWNGNGAVFFVTFIGPLAGSVVTNTTYDITYFSDGTTPASELFMEFSMQIDNVFVEFSLTGADLGFGNGPGTFHGTLQTDAFNGVVSQGFPGPNSTIEFVVDVVGGGAVQGDAHFIDSFMLLDVNPLPDCPGQECGTGGACLDGLECVTECGELVQGVECVLFLADSGGLFLLEDLGGFNVGDRVEVTGCLDPGCSTICLQGDGCIFQNTIGQCAPPGGGSDRTLIIKQGACPAPLNPASNGITPMVLTGESDFDVNDIDLSSLELSRCDGVGGSIAPNNGPPGPPGIQVNDVNHPNPDPASCGTGGCTCNPDQGSDGIDDLKLNFNTDEMAAVLALDAEQTGSIITLVLSGTLNNGDTFEAADCIQIVGAGGGSTALSVGSNLGDIWVEVTPLDAALDTGGYISFDRSYPESTLVTITGPIVPATHPDWQLVAIWVNGAKFTANGGTVAVSLTGTANSVMYQYRNMGYDPGPGRVVPDRGPDQSIPR